MADLIEELAIQVWDEEKSNRRQPHCFYFVGPDGEMDAYPFPAPKGSLQSWFREKFNLTLSAWRHAHTVIFAYRAPRSIRFQFVTKDRKRIYCYSVTIDTGEGQWTKPNSELSAEMRKAVKVAWNG